MSIEQPVQGHFPASYRQSREKVLDHARALSHRIPLLIDSRSIAPTGPDGETLALDFLVLGARRPRHVLVVSSATHGVEGFAGSAIQQQLLAEQLPQLALASDTAIVVQHANNPYGFAWLRRVSENNVDINRNFRDSFDKTQASAGYEQLLDAINPGDLSPENEALRWATIARYIDEHGLRAAQQAIIEGQYKYPHGLQFGGHQLEPCVTHLRNLVQEHLCDAQTVLWLDVHTGLGESGDCELISSFETDNPVYWQARNVWGDAVHSSQSGQSVSTPLNGVMDRGLARWLAPACNFGFVAAEFGTYPVEQILKALRADNWLHQHGPGHDFDDPLTQQIKAQLVEALRPDLATWRMQILATGKALIDKAIQALPGASSRS